MRGFGGLLIILGAGSFILPSMGYQFRVMSIFGDKQPVAAVAAIIIGGVLLGLSFMGGKKQEEKK